MLQAELLTLCRTAVSAKQLFKIDGASGLCQYEAGACLFLPFLVFYLVSLSLKL